MSLLSHPSPDRSGTIATLLTRRLADGGFAETVGGDYRGDATAWAALCLDACQSHPEVAAGARARLSATQLPNGCIPLNPDYPEAVWPTAAAAMALHDVPDCAAAHDKAVGFLLATTGRQFPSQSDSPLGHDTSLTGWPWIADTHSWVEPTAMAIRALTLAGHSAHPRVQAGVRLLLDRQLPDGGWNYGNTTVYGKTLNAMPAPSGMALWSLAGLIEAASVAASLSQLTRQLPKLRTPLSLGWVLQGLNAWGVEPPDVQTLLADCLSRQQRFGAYGTSHLALLLTVTAAPKPGGDDRD